jgi:hypothetical protein
MEGRLIISEPKYPDIFVNTEKSYRSEKEAMEELSWHERIIAQKQLPLSETEITEITIAGIPYQFFIKRDKLFYRIMFRPYFELLERLERKGVEIYQGFIVQDLKKGYNFYEIGSIDGANIYLLIGGQK